MIFNTGSGGAGTAEQMKYDNAESGLQADNVQGAIDEVTDSLEEQPQFVYDENGQITGYTTKIGGADTVFPFKKGNKCTYIFGYIGGASAFYYFTNVNEDNAYSAKSWSYGTATTHEDEYLKVAYTVSHKLALTFYSKCTVALKDGTQTEYESGDTVSFENAHSYCPMSIVFN